MENLLQHIKSLKVVYFPSLWFAVLLVGFFFPNYVIAFMFGTVWGVLWLAVYYWFHDK